MGYQAQTVSNQNIERLIAQSIERAKSIIKPQGNYIRLEEIVIKGDKVDLGAGQLKFSSQDIADLLANQQQVALLAVTVGPEIEAKVKELFADDQLTKATIFDAIGSVAVENLAEQLNQTIAQRAKEIGLPSLTMRYSPGYGDLSLEIQDQLLNLVEGQDLGIKTNDSQLLIPQKSITALIGLGQTKSQVQAKCDFNCASCDYDSCLYK
ncbi:MAG: hypothetical protein ACQEP9_09275 [Bacillota bacterium]